MLKKLFVILFLILIWPLSVQAHTTLLSSTPSEGERITQELEEAELVFGTRIEQGSTMSIQGESRSYEFDSITVAEDSMVGEFSGKLDNGSYRILWSIIGEDGHPIEGEIAFDVSIETEEVVTAPEADEKTEEPAQQSVAVSEEEAASAATTESDGNLLVTILIILAAVLVVFGIYKLLMKKK